MEATIRVAALAGYRDLVFELGGDPGAILRQLGLDDEVLMSPETRISMSDYRAAMNLAGIQTGVHNFGLLLSQRQQFEEQGALGYLTKLSPTLGDAINQWLEYLKQNQPVTQAPLIIMGDTALWTVRLSPTSNVPDFNHAEAAAGVVVKFIRRNVDPLWDPDAVHFSHKAPADKSIYSRIFRCPVFFGAEMGCIEFPASDLERPLRYADPILHRLLKTYEQNKGQPAHETIADKIARILSAGIGSEQLTQEKVAQKMGLSRSQIQSRLRAEGASYQQILDRVRIDRAKKLLNDTAMSLTEISISLGFAQSSVFTRAFKRSTGMTPSAWKRQMANS